MTPLAGAEAPEEAPKLEVTFPILKAKAGKGYSAAGEAVKGQVEAAQDGIAACVREHAPEGAEGKLKLTLTYDADGARVGTKVRKDSFGGADPMPCIVSMFEAMEPGAPNGGTGSIKLAMHLVAKPAAAPAEPPEPIEIALGPDGVTVSPAGLKEFEVPATAGDSPHLVVAKKLELLGSELPDGAAVRVRPSPDVPWGEVVRIVDALRRPVEGGPLFAEVGLLPPGD